MELMLYIAIFAGIMLYISKLISFYMLLSPFPQFRNWMVKKPVRLAVIDLIFGMLGLHIVSMAAGSVTAMLIMIVFGTCSVIYISIMAGYAKFQERSAITLEGGKSCHGS